MEEEKVSREELRKRLRDKIRGKRSGNDDKQTLQKNLKEDPTGSFLRMGIDDPDLLRQASQLVSDPHRIMSKLRELPTEISTDPKVDPPVSKVVEVEVKDHEELPPEFIWIVKDWIIWLAARRGWWNKPLDPMIYKNLFLLSWNSNISSSINKFCTAQSSWVPSGIYRRMTAGFFRCLISSIAILSRVSSSFICAMGFSCNWSILIPIIRVNSNLLRYGDVRRGLRADMSSLMSMFTYIFNHRK